MPASLKTTVGAISVAGGTTSSPRIRSASSTGQLEFLRVAEVRVQAALAHPGRCVQSKG
jgi:hypothetical protein